MTFAAYEAPTKALAIVPVGFARVHNDDNFLSHNTSSDGLLRDIIFSLWVASGGRTISSVASEASRSGVTVTDMLAPFSGLMGRGSTQTVEVETLAEVQVQAPLESDSAWLDLAYKQTSLSLGEMEDFIDIVANLVCRLPAESLDQRLTSVFLKEMNTDSIVALCKLTYPVRHSLKCWGKTVAASRNEIERRGEDPRNLKGLD